MYSNMITIRPKYIFKNMIEKPIYIKQSNANHIFTLQNKEKSNTLIRRYNRSRSVGDFYWQENTFTGLVLSLEPFASTKAIAWSAQFQINTFGQDSSCEYILPFDNDKNEIFHVTIKWLHKICFIMI